MFDWPYSRMWKHSLLFQNKKDAEGSCSHYRSLQCRLREPGLAFSFPPIRKYSEEFLLCSSKSFYADCFVSLVQVHFICEKTTSTFFLLFQKLAASLENALIIFVLFQAFCLREKNAWNIFHLACRSIKHIYAELCIPVLQNKVNWTNPGASVITWNFTCDKPTVLERLLIIAMEHNRSSSFYSEFRSDIIMKASSALIRRQKRSRQEITFKGSDHRWEENTGYTVVTFFSIFAEFVRSFK